MRELPPEPELAALLAKYDESGGVLDYVFLESETEGSPELLHRAAALAGMAAIDRRMEQWAIRHASEELPIEKFFRVWWDETKLAGELVPFSVFWGTDDVEVLEVDGYKTAFFHPPYSLRGSMRENAEWFAGINRHIFGDDPQRAEIFSWSTDWSNYFEAGHEWWGAFFWTIRWAGSNRFVVIGASTTD